VRHVGDVAAAHDGVGLLQRRLGVALHDRRVAERVAVAAERLLGAVVAPALVDERRARGHRGLEVGDRRERLVVDLDQGDRRLGGLGGQRRDARDDVGLEAHLVLREQAAVLHHAAVEHVGHVLVREHRDDAGVRACLGHVDARDARMRVVGVAELRVRLTGQVQIRRVPPVAGDLLLAVRTDEGLRLRLRFECRHASPPLEVV
jgi:hypothetical protein